jgi:5-methylcytosine-specific restriction endonuclease McrBC regulatory subunit McrC
MKQQLENKAIEAVDLLDELDQNDQVPEQFHRLRGQDNFPERKYQDDYGF